MPLLRTPTGEIVSVPADEADTAEAGGYTRVDLGQAGATAAAPASEDRGVLGGINAAATSLLSGATLGLSDYALKGTLDQGKFSRLAQEREGHPIASGIGQVAGAILPSIAAPESLLGRAPAGIVGHATADAVAAGRAIGGAGGVARQLAAAGVEGAIQNAGMYLSDTALGDRDLSAEGLAGALGPGFAFGAAGGAAALGIEQGTIAARRLFSRAAGTDKAAQAAESAWKEQYQAHVEASDAASDIAKAKLAEAKAAREQAQLAKQRALAAQAEAKARPMPAQVVEPPEVPAALPPAGAAAPAGIDWGAIEQSAAMPPEQLAAQRSAILGKAAEDELASAVADHATARADLEDMLRRLEAPAIEPGVVPSNIVPMAEFGAPGMRGYDPGNVRAPGPPSAVEAVTGDVTAVGKKRIAQGTPVTEGHTLGGMADLAPAALETVPESAAVAPRAAEHVPEYASLEQTLKRTGKDYVEQTVPASAIAERGYYEPPIRPGKTLTLDEADPVRMANARAAIKEGQREAVTLNVTPSGKITVGNGRHRLAAAIEADAPIKVKWSTGYEPSEEMILKGAPKSEPAATDTLTGQLRGMQERLSAGESLGEISGAAPRTANGTPAPTGAGLEGTLRATSDRLAAGEPLSAISDAAPLRKSYVVSKQLERGIALSDPAALKDVSETFSVPHSHIGDTPLTLTTETKPLVSGGKPRTYVKVTRKLANGEEVPVATAEFVHRDGGLYPEHVVVDQPWQRQGIGTHIYDAAERVSGKPILQSEAQTVEGKAFRDSREQSKFFAELTRPKTRHAYGAANIGRAWREEGSYAAAQAKVEREWAAISGHPMAPAGLEAEHAAAVERAAAATSPAEQLTAEHEIQVIERQMTAVGKRPGAVEDVAAVAEVATKYEKASARLTEALGPDAPPAAQEAAKAFRAAEDASDRKAMDRTTRAIDDHAEAQAKRDVVVTRRTTGNAGSAAAPDWLDEARRMSGKRTPEQLAERDRQFRRWELDAAKGDVQRADVGLSKARVAETEASIGARGAGDAAAKARAAMDAARPAAASEASGGSRLGAIATTIGVAGELGVPGIPKPHEIPVIGPLLSTYLKYRAIKAAAGRFMGRIPATGDARAAALVARTKDKIVKAVDRTLGLAEAAAPKARGAVVAAATVLGHRAFDDGEPDAPKGATTQQLAAVRIREIANAATRPDLVTALVRKELSGVTDPDLIDAAEKHLIARYQWLNSVMPKAPAPNPYTMSKWVPTQGQAHEVAQRLAVVNDPEAAFVDTTPAKADTLRNVSPKLLELAQQRLLERVSDIKSPVPYQQRLRGSLLFGVQLDDSLDPQAIAIMQAAHAANRASPTPQPASPPTSSIAADTHLNTMYQTGMDRRAMR